MGLVWSAIHAPEDGDMSSNKEEQKGQCGFAMGLTFVVVFIPLFVSLPVAFVCCLFSRGDGGGRCSKLWWNRIFVFKTVQFLSPFKKKKLKQENMALQNK